MAQVLRAKRRGATEASARGDAEAACPVCMEHTEDNRFCFPCGHWICDGCNQQMLQRNFLACPTCRTPREGVSQRQVDAANRARTEQYAEQDGAQSLVLRAGGQELRVMFFPDESEGANPFGPLGHPGRSRNATDDDHMLAQVIEAASAVQSVLPHLAQSSEPGLRLEGPMRELVDRLLRPSTMEEFLAQREAVRTDGGVGRRTRRRSGR